MLQKRMLAGLTAVAAASLALVLIPTGSAATPEGCRHAGDLCRSGR